ncbi:MAG: benzoate 1,2-dioxygenase small subunit [Neisseria sp.]|jgi:benzoate/toluate 1,2-dioxygenase beta subunit|uniref:benzoate 1,2-dioxygenase small subunit n=1 Tax=Uruburuella suis TaxID=252130 RepID=UPI001B6B710C|nr:benzoate 1,2-dioxygenase small subunit [Neisseria sp.]MBP7259501.1 benzoate 1,2-dioxygenase small subunit [Neisseria sp.]MBP8045768.1 benzoate 1,2-dioxygenase small subunit [Neisseria sp.]MBP8069340.1 benzoate 1,2-dioxygenase small subunit [Neisseria sp.]HRL34442.1 benzoate 1,2-dioxygenase small subunit [Neisseria sp.]
MSRIEQISQFLYREARYLDDKQWEKWLACYHPQASFWMPSWDDDGSLVTDPQREISLIYYPDRQGLEDRVFRIETERSSATIPDTRTSHNISNVEILAEEGAKLTVRFNWLTFSFRYHTTHTYYGCSEYDLDVSGNEPLITRKYVVLKNDYINQLIDVYHV